MPVIQIALLIFVVLFIILFFYFVPLGMWVQAVVSLGLGYGKFRRGWWLMVLLTLIKQA